VLPSQRTLRSGSSRPESLLSPHRNFYFPSTRGFLSSDVTVDATAIFPKSFLKSRHSFISEHGPTLSSSPYRKYRLSLEIPATNADRFNSPFTLLSDSFKEPKS
jgi:hypothetical protein